MMDGWRNTLSIYVNQYNQDEVDYGTRSQSTVVTDLEYLMSRGGRKHRLDQWYKERRAVPLRNETRAKLIREIQNREGEIEVELQFFRTTYYNKGGARHQEERVEEQRLTLVRDEEDWFITRIEHRVPERHASFILPRYQTENVDSKNGPSSPFLNKELLGGVARSTAYRRKDAVQYADKWWNDFNPEFSTFEVDCTHFISQCLFAGGAPINYTGKRESGWWYKGYVNGKEAWSFSWAVAGGLERHLTHSRSGLRAEVVDRPEQLQLGDVIIYDWDGDGAYQHSTIVTAFDAGGMPLVNAHTTPSRHRYWDYKDSYAWTENTVYRFFHIADWF
ncbi:amidase domain-containing protein [Paenibacillus sp. FSL K6-2524]|uniref:amidase domain-containing protein n=2 Tax=Paenibacillus sp. FSL K6-2524 TaxID=2954516 RepID=UPI0030F7BBA0